MKRKSHFTNHLLRAIVLVLAVALTSCEQLGYLICPIIPSTAPLIPPAPYDEEVGDCALIGKSEEIDAWLAELEQIAESCHANRETNWADTLAARTNLDSKVDELDEVEFQADESESESTIVQELCPSYNDPDSVVSDVTSPTPTHYYTDWLKRIGEDVGKYCTMIDELVKPLWQACDEINFYQDCQAPNPDQYHLFIELKMNVAQVNYDYTNFFYTHTLQTYGWGNFRTYFNETSINCTPAQQLASIPTTTFTFYKNAFCRIGPSLKYEKVNTFLEFQSVQIDGRNQSEPRWWWVLIPGSSEHCWVSDSTGSAAGSLEDLDIVAAPPLIISPVEDQPKAKVCSKDLGESACVAAGGTWTTSAAGPSYCDCK